VAALHTYTSEHSDNFFNKLKDCDNYEIFEQSAIKKIIEFKWPLTREYTIKKQLIPYLVFMFTFLIYMNEVYVMRFDYAGMDIVNYVFIVILGCMSGYFFTLEMKQLRNEGLDYLKSFWNYLDLIPPLTLSIFLPMELLGFFDYRDQINVYLSEQAIASQFGKTVEDPTVTIRTIEGMLQSILSLIVWLKLLYFLRIFKSTGYYIRTITEVIKDMRYFLLMLLLTFIAFGDSMR
jgi:Polycystin cation channel